MPVALVSYILIGDLFAAGWIAEDNRFAGPLFGSLAERSFRSHGERMWRGDLAEGARGSIVFDAGETSLNSV